MTTARAIEAYRRRLAKRETAYELTGECLGAVIAWADFQDGEPLVRCGTLTAFKVYTGAGLFGPTRYVEISICSECVGRQPTTCEESAEATHTVYASTVINLHRNEAGVRDQVAAAFPDLIGAGA